MIHRKRKWLFVTATVGLAGAVCLLIALVAEVVIRLQRSIAISRQITSIELHLKDQPTSRLPPPSDAESLERMIRSNAGYSTSRFADPIGSPNIYRPYVEYRQTPGRLHNSLGYRGAEFEVHKPKNVFRILFYGGSFVWGTGARSDFVTIPAHLQRMLDRNPLGKKRVEVINCGELNYCSTQELVYLTIEGVLLSPDLVIFLDGVNDTAWGYSNLPAGYHGDYHQINSLLRQVPLKSIYTVHELDHLRRERSQLWWPSGSLLLKRMRRLFDRSAAFRNVLLNTDDQLRESTPRHLELVREFRRPEEYALRHFYNIRCVRALGKEFGFESIFFTQPVPVVGKPLHDEEIQILQDERKRNRWIHHELAYWEDHYETYLDKLVAQCQSSGYPLVDLRNIFSEHPERLYIDDCHLEGQGYQIVAATIYDELKSRDLLNRPSEH